MLHRLEVPTLSPRQVVQLEGGERKLGSGDRWGAGPAGGDHPAGSQAAGSGLTTDGFHVMDHRHHDSIEGI